MNHAARQGCLLKSPTPPTWPQLHPGCRRGPTMPSWSLGGQVAGLAAVVPCKVALHFRRVKAHSRSDVGRWPPIFSRRGGPTEIGECPAGRPASAPGVALDHFQACGATSAMPAAPGPAARLQGTDSDGVHDGASKAFYRLDGQHGPGSRPWAPALGNAGWRRTAGVGRDGGERLRAVGPTPGAPGGFRVFCPRPHPSRRR